MKYAICTGYVANSKTPIDSKDFYSIWKANNDRYSSPAKTIVVSSTPNQLSGLVDANTILIETDYNHGHIQDGNTRRQLCGWTAHFMAGAVVAFNCGLDFIFKEQDCLAFGPWVDQLYADLSESGGMVIGQPLKVYPRITTTNSLVLIRHNFILPFIQYYLELPWDDNADFMPERKFKRLLDNHPHKVKLMSFGVDRDRPMPMDSNGAWYAQQLNLEEYNQLKEQGLV